MTSPSPSGRSIYDSTDHRWVTGRPIGMFHPGHFENNVVSATYTRLRHVLRRQPEDGAGSGDRHSSKSEQDEYELRVSSRHDATSLFSLPWRRWFDDDAISRRFAADGWAERDKRSTTSTRSDDENNHHRRSWSLSLRSLSSSRRRVSCSFRSSTSSSADQK